MQKNYAYRSEYEERPRWRRWLKWSGWTLLALTAVILIAAGVYVKLIVDDLSKMSTQPFGLAGLEADATGRTNILILGEGDPGHAGEGLTDTIMLISYDRTSGRLAEVSVPRDLRVDIPGFGEGKINSANADGGVSLAEQTVANTLGVPVDYYVLVDFTGFKKLVDAVGGVDVNVKQALIDLEYPCEDNQWAVCGLDIEPGLQHIDGTRALQYTRCRKGTCGDDFGRAARQQEVLKLVLDKTVQWEVLLNPSKLKPITTAIGSSVKTDMSARQLGELALDWQKAGKQSIIRLVLNYGTGGYLVGDPAGSSDLLPVGGDFSAIQSRVQKIFTEPTQTNDLPQ